MALTRARAKQTEIWPVELHSSLPVVPVPLQDPDPEVPLDLQTAFNEIYEEAAYDLSVDYRQSPPPPTFLEAETQWLQSCIAAQFGEL